MVQCFALFFIGIRMVKKHKRMFAPSAGICSHAWSIEPRTVSLFEAIGVNSVLQKREPIATSFAQTIGYCRPDTNLLRRGLRFRACDTHRICGRPCTSCLYVRKDMWRIKEKTLYAHRRADEKLPSGITNPRTRRCSATLQASFCSIVFRQSSVCVVCVARSLLALFFYRSTTTTIPILRRIITHPCAHPY